MSDELKVNRPVRGDIQSTSRQAVPQVSASEFLAEIDAALSVPGVRALVWEQYTPYFNDGDPCEFSINEVRAKLAGVSDEDEDTYDLEFGDAFSTYDLYNYRSDSPAPWKGDLDAVDWVKLPGVDTRAVYEMLSSLKTGSWESVAKANFGDHAQVTATADGFDVEYYEHD